MRWMDDLYVGDLIYRDRKKVRRRIESHRPTVKVYVLFLAVNPANQVEIMDANYLHQPYYRKRDDLTIVGLAGCYREALDLVTRMADDCFRRTGTGDLRAFLTERLAEAGSPRRDRGGEGEN